MLFLPCSCVRPACSSISPAVFIIDISYDNIQKTLPFLLLRNAHLQRNIYTFIILILLLCRLKLTLVTRWFTAYQNVM